MSSFRCNTLTSLLSVLILFHFDKNHFSFPCAFTEGYFVEVKHPRELIDSWLLGEYSVRTADQESNETLSYTV